MPPSPSRLKALLNAQYYDSILIYGSTFRSIHGLAGDLAWGRPEYGNQGPTAARSLLIGWNKVADQRAKRCMRMRHFCKTTSPLLYDAIDIYLPSSDTEEIT